MIIPLLGRLVHLETFLENLKRLNQSDFDIFLIFVIFDFNPQSAKQIINKYTNINIECIYMSDQSFSRAIGIEMGIRHVEKSARQSAVIAVMDIDVIFKKNFLSRCFYFGKTSPYFPILFNQYKSSSTVTHTEKVGYWREFGFGIVCMKLSDYLTSGGMDLTINEWGKEDSDFFTKLIQSQVQVIRCRDPDLFHLYHSSDCSSIKSNEHRAMCITSKYQNFGSKYYLFNLFNKH